MDWVLVGEVFVLIVLVTWLVLHSRPDVPPLPPPPPFVREIIRERVPLAPPPRPTVRVQFVSRKGRPLGSTLIDATQRRPVLRYRVEEVLGVFNADHQAPDGTWIYRRTGVEREDTCDAYCSSSS